MPRRNPSYVPKLGRHKGTSQGRVRFPGNPDVYLGHWPADRKDPPPQVRARYDAMIADWLEMGRGVRAAPQDEGRLTIAGLALRFLHHASREYVKRGKPTSEQSAFRSALSHLLALYHALPADRLTCRELVLVRARMVAVGWARQYVNEQIQRLRRVWNWSSAEGLVDDAVAVALSRLQPLRRGKTTARETVRVKPVDWKTGVKPVLRFLQRPVRAMLKISYLTGCRPQDVCVMRACDIDQAADRRGVCWLYRPASFKTEHLAESDDDAREIWLGPRCQRILAPFLAAAPTSDAYLFPPAEPVAGRKPGPHYTTDSYRRAIERACDRAGVPRFGPNRLRHTRGTLVRRRHGLEAAQAVLGHKEISTTQTYAERLRGTARRIAAKSG